MPELITKHPDTVLQVLQSAPQVQCGANAGPPQILTQCPSNQFCRLPQGEVCVYGLNQINNMTQITPEELCYWQSLQSQSSINPPF